MSDLERIALQEQRLQFKRFDATTAWTLGMRLKEAAEAHSVTVAIDIQLHGQPLFFYAMPGTTPDNVDWIRRKRNVVIRFQRSSYAVGLHLQQQQTTLETNLGVDTRDYAPHGGCFPLNLLGTGCIGTITVSGLPQRQDHELVVEVLAEMLGQSFSELALGELDGSAK
ncbi:MAG: heme-degrading domain-containing protein [Roseiflexaceae bacterium]